MKTVRAANALLRSTSAPLARTGLTSSRSAGVRPRFLVLAPQTTAGARPFSTTPSQLKKKDRGGGGGKDAKETSKSAPAPSSSSSSSKDSSGGGGPQPNPSDPFDLGDLTSAFDKADQRFGDVLRQIRQGGRFSAEALGALPVQADRGSAATFPLRELATVAAVGGRRWSILAFEEASVKAIMSAVQRSEAFNQQPQRSEDNPLELVLTVEPERAEEVARRVKAECQAWRDRLRDEAHRREKVNKKWRAEGLIVADDLTRLKGMVQKMQDERMKVVAQKEKELLQFVAAKG
ncbi:ribosome recycling factor domain-containing protein [Podospora conica]|nr:ribosome recycling factor domain-containing protein [Schizothecium conicum]